MATKYQEALGRYEAKLAEVHRIIDEKPDYNWSEQEVEAWQAGQKELADLNAEVQRWREVDEQVASVKRARDEARRPAAGGVGFSAEGDDARSRARSEDEPEAKSWGEMFVQSDAYKRGRGQTNPAYGIDLETHTLTAQKGLAKATITTAAGFAPYPARQARVVDYAVRRTMVGDLMPNINTNDSSIIYMEETTFTNNAAPVAEDGAKPESALAWTQRSVPVEVIATYVVISEQQLEDVDRMQATVDNRLTVMLQLAEESQLLNGTGSTPQLQGFYNKSGVQTQSGSGIDAVDAIYKGFTKVRHTGFAEPSAVVLHPNDWEPIRLMRTDGGAGVYIFGSPAEAGPETIWGKKLVVTTAATENTGLTGDFELFSELYRKRGIRVEVGRINDDFVKNRLVVRAEERVALVILRPSAFVKVTNI